MLGVRSSARVAPPLCSPGSFHTLLHNCQDGSLFSSFNAVAAHSWLVDPQIYTFPTLRTRLTPGTCSCRSQCLFLDLHYLRRQRRAGARVSRDVALLFPRVLWIKKRTASPLSTPAPTVAATKAWLPPFSLQASRCGILASQFIPQSQGTSRHLSFAANMRQIHARRATTGHILTAKLPAVSS